jgi:hypothetical protein
MEFLADSSHMFHEDGRGQGGYFITLGNGFVMCRCVKIPMVTLSSTETEGVGICTIMTYVVWMRVLLRSFGYSLTGPSKVYQDNLATIWLAKHDGSFARTKHIVVKKYYVRERLEAGDAILVHRSGADLAADMMTKVVPAATMIKHMQSVGMEKVV